MNELNDDAADGTAGESTVPTEQGRGAGAPVSRRRVFPLSRRSTILATAAVAAAAVAGAAIVGWGPFDRSDWDGDGYGSVRIRVAKGETAASIGRTLVAGQSVRTVEAFTRAAEAHPEQGRRIRPGTYDMRLHMSASAALRRFFDPAAKVQMRIRVADGQRASKVLVSINGQSGIPLADVAAAADSLISRLPEYAAGSLEGFLYPDTYIFDPAETPREVLATIITTAIRRHQQAGLLDPPPRLGLSPREVLTVASILEVESHPRDYAKVARVIYNRLARGQRLQLDSTLNYALGTSKWAFTASERRNPSRYNTFAHSGLPPGPIGNPGAAAIKAAMAPADGPWIYFVTTNPTTGLTEFASTDAEFNVLRDKFRQWLASRK